MAVKNLEFPKFRYTVVKTDANGNSYLSPASGYKVYTYEAGTTTLLTTYSDFDLTTPNTNPVILNSDGSANIFFSSAMKVDLLSDTDVRVTGFPVDDIPTGEEVTVTGNYNLVQNGSFEIDTGSDLSPDSWTISPFSGGTVQIDTTINLEGENSLKFDGTGSGGGTATSSFFDVIEGTVYGIGFSYYSSNAGTTNIVQVQFFTAADVSVSTTTIHNSAGVSPTTWTTYASSFTVPSTARKAKLVLTGVSSGGAQLSDNTWFDAVQVYPSDNIYVRKITGSTSTGYTASFTYTGTTNDDIAVFGNVSGATGNTFALYGLNASATGHGVFGYASHATGINYGVRGQTDSSAGYAGYFSSTIAGGIPVWAIAHDSESTTATVAALKGSRSISLNPRVHVGGYNPIAEAGDQIVVSIGPSGIDTGVLTLAPYATDAVGIRIDSTDDSVNISGTTVSVNGDSIAGFSTGTLTFSSVAAGATFGNTATHTLGTILTSDIVIMGACVRGSISTRNITCYMSHGVSGFAVYPETLIQAATGVASFTAVTSPGATSIGIVGRNDDASTQTITVDWWIGIANP